MSAQVRQTNVSRPRRQWLYCGVALVLAACMLFGCKCKDKAAEKPDTSFCDDQTAWNRWETLVEQFKTDDRMMELHALRLGICSMIYTGQIEPERGIRLFEKTRVAWVKRMMGMQRHKAARIQKKKSATPTEQTPQQDIP